MSRKPKKGYFVRGQFVAEGSELDLEFKRELKGTSDATRTDLKRASTELQKLGEDLLTLRTDLMARLDLSEKLVDAVAEAKRITNFEGKRRQMQYIGKLMRGLDDEQLNAVRAALNEQLNGSAEDNLRLHQAESWRERMVADDEAVGEWIAQFPGTDIQQLRSLVRQIRKDAPTTHDANVAESQGTAPRKSRAYRELFILVRAQLASEHGEEEDSRDNPFEEMDDGDGN